LWKQVDSDDSIRVFYWFGAYYSYALLAQAIIMVAVQLVLLKVALDNRPAPGIKDGIEHVPFSGHEESSGWPQFSRPYNFWQWRSTRPYVSWFRPSLPGFY